GSKLPECEPDRPFGRVRFAHHQPGASESTRKIAGGDQVCGKAPMVPSAGQQQESAAGSAKRPSPGTTESAKVGKTPAQHGFSARAACPHPAACAGSG